MSIKDVHHNCNPSPGALLNSAPVAGANPGSASFPPHILLSGESHFCAFKKQIRQWRCSLRATELHTCCWSSDSHLDSAHRTVAPGGPGEARQERCHWEWSPFVSTGRRKQGQGLSPRHRRGGKPSHVFRQQRRLRASSSWHSTS